MIWPGRKAAVKLWIETGPILDPKYSDAAVGEMVRIVVRGAHEELKRFIPGSTAPQIYAQLIDFVPDPDTTKSKEKDDGR